MSETPTPLKNQALIRLDRFPTSVFVRLGVLPHQPQDDRAQEAVLDGAGGQVRLGLDQNRLHDVRPEAVHLVLIQLLRYPERVRAQKLEIHLGQGHVVSSGVVLALLRRFVNIVLGLLDQDEQPLAQVRRDHVHQPKTGDDLGPLNV